MTWDDGLTDQQRVVAGVEDGHHLLIAGPGTGKTHVLVRRAQFLIESSGVSPREVSAITFTRAAAGEMRSRLDVLLENVPTRPRVATLHSFALRELLAQGAAAIERPVRVVDDWEERWVVEEELARILATTVRRVQKTLTLLANDWDSLAVDGAGWEEGFSDPRFLTAWRAHRAVYGYTLRSELVYQMLNLYRTNPDLAPAFDLRHLIVDEYQDLNNCDLRAIRYLVERSGAHIYAAGDDDQSIYSFRMAHPDGIREFRREYPDSSLLRLEECLRCGPEVVHIANWLIEQDLDRVAKTLESVTTWDARTRLISARNEPEEAQQVVALVQAAIADDVPASEILILLPSDKNGGMSGEIVDALESAGIDVYLPRATSAVSAESQRFLEYLRLAQSLSHGTVDDLSLRALLELEPDNNVGRGRLLAVVRAAVSLERRFSETLDFLREDPTEYRSNGLSLILDARDQIIETAQILEQREGETLLDWTERVLDELGPGDEVRTLVGEAAEMADEVLQDLGDIRQGETLDFVAELGAAMAEIEDSRPPKIDGKVTITTMHGAKGLSADVVSVLHAEDEIIPDGSKGIEFEEARRLLYVSLTRARKSLNVHVCDYRVKREFPNGIIAPNERTLTRFLEHYGLEAERP